MSDNPSTQSKTDLLDDSVQLEQKKKVSLETMLVELDKNLEDVVSQMDSLKSTRDELFATTKKLQQNLELCGGSSGMDEKDIEKVKALSTEIKKRENVVRALEKRELLLSHSMLGVISKWADEVEKTLGKKGFGQEVIETQVSEEPVTEAKHEDGSLELTKSDSNNSQ